jgi:excisionase family DNA binding protein
MRIEVVAGITQAVIGMLYPAAAVGSQPADDPSGMLSVSQAAALLGVSRMTVIRKADAGELPCVVVSRGTRQKLRRFPPAHDRISRLARR